MTETDMKKKLLQALEDFDECIQTQEDARDMLFYIKHLLQKKKIRRTEHLKCLPRFFLFELYKGFIAKDYIDMLGTLFCLFKSGDSLNTVAYDVILELLNKI